MSTVFTHEDTIHVYLTARDTQDRLAYKGILPLHSASAAAQAEVTIEPSVQYQEILGFGGSFTEAAAYALERMSPARRDEILRSYFSADSGAGYTVCRTHINSCDFSLGNYSYCDTPGDFDLSTFDISRDRSYLIPMIREALRLSPSPIRLIASPWSPPAWMKTNGEMNNGGKLKPECRSSWAGYIAKYIHAYRKEGIDIWGITIQNEPRAKQTWDSCLYTHEEQRDFLRDYLGPELRAQGLEEVKILIWDHNRDEAHDCAKVILSDAEAARYVWGVAFHWYSGDEFDNIERIHKDFPSQRLVFTEGCQEGGVNLGSWELGERYAHSIIGDLNHWTCAWIDWNLVLDEQGGPNHAGNLCDAPIIADGLTDVVNYQNSFDYIRHFSCFIQPGAVRVRTVCSDGSLDVTGACNPDGSLVIVVLNRTERSISCSCGTESGRALAEMPPRSIATYLFKPDRQESPLSS